MVPVPTSFVVLVVLLFLLVSITSRKPTFTSNTANKNKWILKRVQSADVFRVFHNWSILALNPSFPVVMVLYSTPYLGKRMERLIYTCLNVIEIYFSCILYFLTRRTVNLLNL